MYAKVLLNKNSCKDGEIELPKTTQALELKVCNFILNNRYCIFL